MSNDTDRYDKTMMVVIHCIAGAAKYVGKESQQKIFSLVHFNTIFLDNLSKFNDHSTFLYMYSCINVVPIK